MSSSLNNLKLYYFPLGTRGRAEPIVLLLQDQGIKYEQINVTDWAALKAELQAEQTLDRLPFIMTEDNKKYFGSIPIIRFLSTKLGLNRKDEDEEQFLDSVVDYANDWYSKMLTVVFGIKTDEALEKYVEEECPKHMARFERLYGAREGPYLMGAEMTYVDLFLYHLLDDDVHAKNKLKDYPNLTKLRVAVQERPNIKAYLASLDKTN